MSASPLRQDLAAFIHEHWLRTQQSKTDKAKWFVALSDRGWRFVDLDPRLGGPDWSLNDRLYWRKLTHDSNAPFDHPYFAHLILALVNHSLQGETFIPLLEDWAMLDWQIMPDRAEDPREPREATVAGQGQLYLPGPEASDDSLTVIWKKDEFQGSKRVALTFARPLQDVLRSLINPGTLYQSLLEAADYLEALKQVAAQQFLDEDLSRELAEEAISLSALTRTFERHARQPTSFFLPRVMARFQALDRLSRAISGPYAVAPSVRPGNEASLPAMGITPSGRQTIDWLTPWWMPEPETPPETSTPT